MKRICLTTALCLLGTVSSLLAQATIDESVITKNLRVDPNGKGDFTTIKEAFGYLQDHPEEPVKVVIAPGMYREGNIRLNKRSAVTVIEGAEAGKVIISGSDIWKDWKDEGEGKFSKPWEYDWGMAAFDDNYKIKDDLGRRCELVFYNGKLLQQVKDAASLVAGSFAVDEEGDKLWLMPPAGSSPADALIEVGVRGELIRCHDIDNFVFRNLVVQHAVNSPVHDDDERFNFAIFGKQDSVTNDTVDNFPGRDFCEHILIENCVFQWNNSSGMIMANSRYVTYRNNKYIDNGNSGASPSRVKHFLVENCDFNRNNWRIGGYGKFTGWAPAGTKMFHTRDTLIKNCRFLDNDATGLWMDFGHEYVTIKDCVMSGNSEEGLYLEASAGPFLVEGCTITNNGIASSQGLSGGILVAESLDVTIQNCLIANNNYYQIGIRTRDRPESSGYWSTVLFDGQVRYLTLRDSKLVGKTVHQKYEPGFYNDKMDQRSGGLIMSHTHSATENEDGTYYNQTFLPTYKGSGNTFYHPDREEVFSNGKHYGFVRVDLADWQEMTGQDLDAKWEKVEVPEIKR